MKKYLLLIVVVIAAINTIAQNNTYNYNQSYSSMNNVLAKQQAETRQRDQHYQNVYGNRSNSTSTTNYSWNRPVYAAPAKKTTYNNNYSNSYSNWGESYAERQRREQQQQAEANAHREAAERSERERRLQQERLDAEYERMRKEKAEKLFQERLAYYKSRQPALAANPLQTIYTPPIFSNAIEKYTWYYDQAFNLSGIADLYACLIVCDMVLAGEGCTPNVRIANEKKYNAPTSTLKWYVLGESLLQIGKPSDYKDILYWYKSAVNEKRDPTNGHVKGYKRLLQLYRSGSIGSWKLPADAGNEADVYAYAALNGDTTAYASLKKVISGNMDSIQNFSTSQLEHITRVLPITGADGDYGLWVWNKWGQKLQAAGDTACFAAYCKSFDNPAAQPALLQTMQIRLVHLYHNDSRFAKRLSIMQQVTAMLGANAYVKSLEGYKEKNWRLQADDLGMLYKYYSGHCGVQPNPEKAVMVATDALLNHQNNTDLQQAAFAFRVGRGGWPKDDAKASQLFRLAADNTSEKTEQERTNKAVYMSTNADFWAADAELGLQKNRTEINYYLKEAARLHPARSDEYAEWCADKKSVYYDKDLALQHFTTAIKWYQDFYDQSMKVDLPSLSTILKERLDKLKSKLAILKLQL